MSLFGPETDAIGSWLGGISARALQRVNRFADKTVVLVGELPFAKYDVASLLPPGCGSLLEAVPNRGRVDCFVIGQWDADEPVLDRCMKVAEEATRFLPQEGFLDELLFGYDWWSGEHELLDDACEYYPGLAYIRDRAEEFAFEWPSTAAEPAARPSGDDGKIRDTETKLHRLGYNSQLGPAERWAVLRRILDHRRMSLEEVVNMIAWYCRQRRRMHNGEVRFARALGVWEDDLARLKQNYYDSRRPRFRWPSTH